MSGQLHAPAATPGREPRYPLYKRLGEPQSRSGRHGEVKILDSTGTRTPTSSVVQPVASRYTDIITKKQPTYYKNGTILLRQSVKRTT
jgi:hypothetical protein